nr:hypothetical protein [Tanacetum cinerariifolium]
LSCSSMDAPPSPNHVFNFPKAEFEEDPQEEPEEEVEEDPEKDPEEDPEEGPEEDPKAEAENDVPPPATPPVGSPITHCHCLSLHQTLRMMLRSEIREGKKRLDKMEQGLGDEMQFSSRVEHRVTDVENRKQEKDEEMVKVKKHLGTLEAKYSLVLSDHDE